ncbi:sensor domain-containing diguanylate cyclase [Thiolapillus brandeum]|nr:GGDEF domain-containing protein [Thiolapillus brandeum]
MSRTNKNRKAANRQVISLEISPVPREPEQDQSTQDDIQYFQEILTRLTFAANGWDKELDHLLIPLQKQLRSSSSLPDLKEISEKLYLFLVQAKKNKPALNEQIGEVLSGFLERLSIPPKLQGSFQEALKSTSKARTNEEIAMALEACLPVLNEALQSRGQKPVPEAPRPKGLFSSLFKGGERNEEPGNGDSDLLAEIQEKLLKLLDDLCTPTELEDQVDDLKEILEDNFRLENIAQVIAGISRLVHDIRGAVNRERRGLEDFLEQLMTRLSLIDSTLAETNESNHLIYECHHQLEENIEEQACSIESQATTATDLGQLKLLLKDRVTAIRNHMEEYRCQEKELIQAAEEKAERLAQRLNELETETDELRKKVSTHSLQALTDTLTGIPNRYAYEEKLNHEYNRWKRYHQPLSLMVVDIDNFKHINDKYGHRAGDKALRIIANQLQKMTRKTDLIARYGGDEFVLLLPETTAKGAMHIAEKLLDTIQTCAFHFRDKKVTITISCGISEFRDGDTPADAFERADQALYKSKHKGRNQSHAG